LVVNLSQSRTPNSEQLCGSPISSATHLNERVPKNYQKTGKGEDQGFKMSTPAKISPTEVDLLVADQDGTCTDTKTVDLSGTGVLPKSIFTFSPTPPPAWGTSSMP
jgi:hypothetical protein